MYNQLFIKKYRYTTLNLYIHPAETHRLLKFLFHKMGRLVPAHNELVVNIWWLILECIVTIVVYSS